MEKVCGICLEPRSQFEIVEDLLKDLLDTLMIKLDEIVLNEPIICKDCIKRIHELFDFKTLCIYTEDALLPFLEEANDKTNKLDLRSVYSKCKLAQSLKMDAKAKICRLCLEISANSILLETALLETSIRNVFENHLPEISLQAIDCPFICESCMKLLHRFDSFASMCSRNPIIMKIKITNDNLCNENLELKDNDDNNDNQEEFSQANDDGCDENQVKNVSVESEDVRNSSQLDMEGALKLLSKMCKYQPQTKTVQCYKCSYETEDKGNLKTHLKSHLPKIQKGYRGKFHKCPKKSCSFISRFDNHIIVAHAKTHFQRIKCFVCGEISETRVANQRHVKMKHTTPGGTYKCDDCPFVIKHREAFDRHIAKHRNEVIVCDLCPFNTIYRGDLIRHKNNQHGFKDTELYYCYNCSYFTPTKQCLRVHVLVHMSDSSSVWYKCEKCGYSSKYKSTIQKHGKRVHAENPVLHTCSICHDKFKTQRLLRMHVLQFHRPDDEERRTYIKKCPECVYETSRVTHLKKHLQNVHGTIQKDKYFNCHKCTFKTIYETSLSHHFELKHQNDPNDEKYTCEFCLYTCDKESKITKHFKMKHKDKQDL